MPSNDYGTKTVSLANGDKVVIDTRDVAKFTIITGTGCVATVSRVASAAAVEHTSGTENTFSCAQNTLTTKDEAWPFYMVSVLGGTAVCTGKIVTDRSTGHHTVTSLVLTPPTATIAALATQQITAVLTNTYEEVTAGAVTYASDDTDIATVNGSGLVTGVAAGEAVITGTVTGTSPTVTDTVAITVSA